MLDTKTLERLMACERLKDELAAIERERESILGRFDRLDREPTGAEHDARLNDYLGIQARLSELNGRLQSLSR
jgi:hypothetical protein